MKRFSKVLKRLKGHDQNIWNSKSRNRSLSLQECPVMHYFLEKICFKCSIFGIGTPDFTFDTEFIRHECPRFKCVMYLCATLKILCPCPQFQILHVPVHGLSMSTEVCLNLGCWLLKCRLIFLHYVQWKNYRVAYPSCGNIIIMKNNVLQFIDTLLYDFYT